MKRILIFALGILFTGALFAQQVPVTEPNYELADRFSAKKVNTMVFSTSMRPNWFKDSDKFWYEWKTPAGNCYYIVDPVTKAQKPVFDLEKLAMELTEITKDPFDAQHIPFRKLKLKDDNTFSFEILSTMMVEKKEKKKKEEVTNEEEKKDEEKKDDDGEEKKEEKKETKTARKPAPKKERKLFKFEYDISSGKLTDVTEEEEEKDYPRWANISPDGQSAVYAKNYNLYWMSIEDVKKLMEDEKDTTVVDNPLTTDGTKEFYYGGGSYRGSDQSDTTKRFYAGVLWSPDSKHFAITRYDVSKLKQLWVINVVTRGRPVLESYNYQMPGEPGATEHLYLFNMENKTSKQINVSAFKDQMIGVMSAPSKHRDTYNDYRVYTWLGDNDKFYMSRTSRDHKRVDICTVNVAEDSCRVVIEERLNTYVETRRLQVVNNGKELIQWSERNGWAHLYLYSSDGTLKNPITTGAFHVENVLHVDETARVVYFLAMGVDKNESPYNGHVYRINFDGTGMRRLDVPEFNSSSVSFCDNGKYFVTNYSRVDVVPKVALFNAAGVKLLDVAETDVSLLLEAGYKFPEPFKVKAADGITDLYGVMYKPFDFDPNKKYPIIDYVYPGPQTEGNNLTWSKGLTRVDRLAQVGFIVITVGNRGGHPNRSKWYHNYGYGNLRDYGLEDQKYAIQQLAARHDFIDINRVGIHGHSGGGFMSTAAILKYPDFFKAAVSCAGNHDNSMYNRWWSEQHHGILEEITAAGDTTFKYSIDKNQDIARNLKGHLLLIHGDIDDNVHPGNTMRVVNALIRANKRFEMLILPGQRHGFGDMNEYFFWKMADWYSEWLLGTSKRHEVDIREMNND